MSDAQKAMLDGIRAGVAEARGETTEDETEGTATAEAPATEAPVGDETTEETPEGAASESETEAAAAAEGTDDVPTEFMGQDLSEFEPDVRKAIIEMAEPREKYIKQLQREKAAAPEKGAETAAEDGQVTEEEVAKTFGYDLDDPDDARLAKAMVPVIQLTLNLKDELGQLRTGVTVRETQTYWTQGLNDLERQYGPLPEGVDHGEVIRIAAESGIAEPVDAYWRIMGPARQTVMDEVKARRENATKGLKRAATQTKPKARTETTPAGVKATTVREGVSEVFKQLQRDGKWKPSPYDDE